METLDENIRASSTNGTVKSFHLLEKSIVFFSKSRNIIFCWIKLEKPGKYYDLLKFVIGFESIYGEWQVKVSLALVIRTHFALFVIKTRWICTSISSHELYGENHIRRLEYSNSKPLPMTPITALKIHSGIGAFKRWILPVYMYIMFM